ncbi:hypothetical protein GEMRC1_007948 [Eukaryota sp. GEM-RC1]
MTETRKRRSSSKTSTKKSKTKRVELDDAPPPVVLLSPQRIHEDAYVPEPRYIECKLDCTHNFDISSSHPRLLIQIAKNLSLESLSFVSDLSFDFSSSESQTIILDHPSEPHVQLKLALERISSPIALFPLVPSAEKKTLLPDKQFTHSLIITTLNNITVEPMPVPQPPPFPVPQVPLRSTVALNTPSSSYSTIPPSPVTDPLPYLPDSAFEVKKQKKSKKDKDGKKKKKKKDREEKVDDVSKEERKKKKKKSKE